MKQGILTINMSNFDNKHLQKLNSLFPSAVIFTVDSNRRIRYWSDGAEALLGFSAKELIGENCLTGNRCQQCMESCSISKFGHVDNMDVTLYHKQGYPLQFSKYATAAINEQGEFEGGVEILLPLNKDFPSSLQLSNTKKYYFHGLISNDSVMQEVFQLVKRVAQTDVNVLVRGESGTGKELIARAIHEESLRSDKPFMALNCASLSASLLESELFGHVKGAFTDAIRDHQGLISRAEGGTLLLDEVAEIPLDLQAKLLRVIQEREYSPVGSNKVIKANIRLLAATHQSLRKLVHEGRFREDLMYRLRVVPLFLPPLRERKSDITLLLNYFISELQLSASRKINDIHPDAMRRLLNYEWPGNVRELRNVVEYANAVSRTSTMTLKDLPPEFLENKHQTNMNNDSSISENENKKIKQALMESEGDLALAAKILGIGRTTLWRKRKKYKI